MCFLNLFDQCTHVNTTQKQSQYLSEKKLIVKIMFQQILWVRIINFCVLLSQILRNITWLNEAPTFVAQFKGKVKSLVSERVI